MIQFTLKISTESFHKETTLHQHLACIFLFGSLKCIDSLRIKSLQEDSSAVGIGCAEYMHISYQNFALSLEATAQQSYR